MTADPLDEPFLAMALAAFVAEARAVQGWPDSEQVRQRAYKVYEDELAARGRREPADPVTAATVIQRPRPPAPRPGGPRPA